MIYIAHGNDTKKKAAYVRGLLKDIEQIALQAHEATEGVLLGYASNISLFGGSPGITIENLLRGSEVTLSANTLSVLAESPTMFIFLEDKMLAADEKKYKKYGAIEKFEEKIVKAAPSVNIFAIADAYEKKDKIGAWTRYLEAIDSGIEPEAISGILFWKIKTMILGNSRSFSRGSLIRQSSALVALYHEAHRGERDFTIGLEQFLLSAFS